MFSYKLPGFSQGLIKCKKQFFSIGGTVLRLTWVAIHGDTNHVGNHSTMFAPGANPKP